MISVSLSLSAQPRSIPQAISLMSQKSSNLTIDCNITGVRLEYIWRHDGVILSESDRVDFDSGLLRITNTRFSDSGSYSCFAKNKAGNATQIHNLTIFGKKNQLSICKISN